MRSFSFSWSFLPILKFHLYFYLYDVDGCFFFRLPMVRQLPFPIKMSFYVVVKLLILLSLSLLFMDELTRAVAQFYPTLGGTNGGFGPPPAPPGPDNSVLLAASGSHETGPSDPNAHVLAETQEGLDRLRQENLRALRENEALIKRAKEELGRLQERFKTMKARDAAKDQAERIRRQALLEFPRTVERDLRFRKSLSA